MGFKSSSNINSHSKSVVSSSCGGSTGNISCLTKILNGNVLDFNGFDNRLIGNNGNNVGATNSSLKPISSCVFTILSNSDTTEYFYNATLSYSGITFSSYWNGYCLINPINSSSYYLCRAEYNYDPITSDDGEQYVGLIANEIMYNGTEISQVYLPNSSTPINILPLSNITTPITSGYNMLNEGTYNLVIWFAEELSNPLFLTTQFSSSTTIQFGVTNIPVDGVPTQTVTIVQ